MRKHWLYLKYLLRHKWFVAVAGRRIGGVSLWRLLIHDWSKFLPCEWSPYVEYFYGPQPDKQEPDDFRYWSAKDKLQMAFDTAWLHHQHWNKHHWQHWILRNDDGRVGPVRMPDKYIHEMVADWCGAGRAITGKWEVWTWYHKNSDKIDIPLYAREIVERLITVERIEMERTPVDVRQAVKG